MRLLEATWDLAGQLLVWAENGSSTEIASTLTSDRKHPFACSHQELSQALELLEFEADGTCSIELSLPSGPLGPLPSPSLITAEEIDRGEAISVETWNLPAVTIEPLASLAFLTSLPEHLPAGLAIDDSFRFWIEATKLLLELLTRGRFIPGLKKENGKLHAHWHTILTEAQDHSRLIILAEAMPPICRALVQERTLNNPEPGVIIESFLSGAGNALIKTFLKSYSLVPDVDLRHLSGKRAMYIEWLRALTNFDAKIQAPEPEINKFDLQLKRWGGSLLVDSKKHELRTCFRLIPPSRSSGKIILSSDNLPDSNWPEPKWTIEFSLTSLEDRSQQISASQIWKGESGFLKHSDFTLEDIEDALLKDLGKAASVFPELMRAMADTHPTHLYLTNTEAYHFLKETAKLLDQLGYLVALPTWWNKPSASIGLHLTVKSEDASSGLKGASYLGMQQLLDHSWHVAVGDQILSPEEFENLAKGKSPLFEINGEWIELQPAKIEATLAFLKSQKNGEKLRFIDALRLGFGVENDSTILPVVGFTTSGWLKELLEASTHSIPKVDQPSQFKGELRPYQLDGLSWLSFLAYAGIGGCLADDMGLGKTIQLLALMLHERERAAEVGASLNPTLLIVPMSILENWEREAQKFSPNLTTYIHHGPNRLSGTAFQKFVENCDIVITTYNLMYRDEALFCQIPWGRLVLDEGQNIKNIDTKQTQAVRRLSRALLQNDNGNTTCQRIVLTGTPLENHLEELWSIFDFLNPGFLGNASDFRSRFAVPIERYRHKDAAATLAKLIRPFVLRRLKTDPKVIDDLPDKIEMDIITTLTEEQAVLYQKAVDNMLPNIDSASGIHRKGLVLATITKLKQICNHPVLFLKDGTSFSGRSGKLSRLEELLEVILTEGDRVLIFTQYAQMGHILKSHLQERFNQEVLFLHGALSRSARNKILDRFQTPQGPQLFVLSLKAGGFGLNLTQANQVIHFDQWWNPAVESQATDRAYRIGQKQNVQVRKFICKGTLEERIHEMLKYKRDLAEQVVGSTKNFITQLSTDELRELLTLSAKSLQGDDENELIA